jgi:hypothetical protein
MPFTVIPSKSVHVDMVNAKIGDLLEVILDDGAVLILGLSLSGPGTTPDKHLTFDSRWMPRDVVAQAEDAARRLHEATITHLCDTEPGDDSPEDPISALAREIRRDMWVYGRDASEQTSDIDVGLTPCARFVVPTWLKSPGLHRIETWVGSAPIKSIRPIDEWDAETTVQRARFAEIARRSGRDRRPARSPQ